MTLSEVYERVVDVCPECAPVRHPSDPRGVLSCDEDGWHYVYQWSDFYVTDNEAEGAIIAACLKYLLRNQVTVIAVRQAADIYRVSTTKKGESCYGESLAIALLLACEAVAKEVKG